MIKLNNVIKVYKNQGESVYANNGIEFEFPDKGLFVILGKSGCGKTTLLNIIAGLTDIDDGKVLFDNLDISNLKENEMDNYRNLKVGIIFQQYNLLPELNVYDNLILPLKIQQRDDMHSKEDYDCRITEVLKAVDLSGYEKRKINELSGGEQQRVAIARVLLKESAVILADEPTGNLDNYTGEKILDILSEISKEKLVIMVTHDIKLAGRYADTIIRMQDGNIESVENNQKKYSFTIVQDGAKKDYCITDKQELIDIIGPILNGSKSDIIISDISVDEKGETDIPHCELQNKVIYNVQKLKLRHLISLAAKFLKKRKNRMIFTTLIFSLSFILLYFALYISFYNKKDVIVDYLVSNNPSILPCNISDSYENDFYNEVRLDYSTGEKLYAICNSELYDTSDFYKVTYNEGMINCRNDETFINATFIYVNDGKECPEVAIGKKVSAKDEIVITDYLADYLGLSVGDKIDTIYGDVTLCGIIKTDYVEYNLLKKLENIDYYSSNELLEYNCTYKYYTAYFLDDNYEENKKNCKVLNITGARLFENNIYTMTKSSCTIESADNLKEDELFIGRLPDKENEVVISETYAYKYDIGEDKLNSPVFYLDIYQNEYNDTYKGLMNFSSFFNSGVIVTGIVKSTYDAIGSDIYFQNEKWNEIKNTYFDFYKADILLAPIKGEYKDFVQKITDNDIFISEPALNKIEEFEYLVSRIKKILYIVLIGIICLNIFTISVFIGISVCENRHNIGILRSMGIPMNNCSKVFSFEFLLLFIMSALNGILLSNFVTKYINYNFMKDFDDNKFNIILMNHIMFVVSMAIVFVTGYLSSKIPLGDIKNKKIKDLL